MVVPRGGREHPGESQEEPTPERRTRRVTTSANHSRPLSSLSAPAGITSIPIMTTIARQALQLLLSAGRFIYAHRRQILDAIARALLAIEAAARWCWAHRQQARDAAVLTGLALLAAAGWTYRAGIWTRQLVHQLSSRSVVLLPHQPIAAVAPITATLAAIREALARLVARLYPEPVL